MLDRGLPDQRPLQAAFLGGGEAYGQDAVDVLSLAGEGFNAKAKLTTQKGLWFFRTYHGLEVALYHALGALPEPKFIHRFS